MVRKNIPTPPVHTLQAFILGVPSLLFVLPFRCRGLHRAWSMLNGLWLLLQWMTTLYRYTNQHSPICSLYISQNTTEIRIFYLRCLILPTSTSNKTRNESFVLLVIETATHLYDHWKNHFVGFDLIVASRTFEEILDAFSYWNWTLKDSYHKEKLEWTT